MGERLPSAVGPEEADLLGPRLREQQAYLRAQLASSWRMEVLLEDLLAELRAQRTATAPTPEPKHTGRHSKGTPSTS
jgi:hypothetical protein